MVASSQPYASEIGLSILKKGGNAGKWNGVSHLWIYFSEAVN